MKSLFLVLFLGVYVSGDSSSSLDGRRIQKSNPDISSGALRGAHPEANSRRLFEMGPSNVNRSMGEKELLVVRIEANDSSTTASEKQLSDHIFDDEVTVSKQLEACSHGKLTIKPATGKNIKNGVTTVEFDFIMEKVVFVMGSFDCFMKTLFFVKNNHAST